MIAVIDDELLCRSEVTFDTVHPRCVGGCKDEFDIVCRTPLDHFAFEMGSHVVEHDVKPASFGVSSPDRFEEGQNFRPSFSFLVMHPQLVFVDVICCQEVADTL